MNNFHVYLHFFTSELLESLLACTLLWINILNHDGKQFVAIKAIYLIYNFSDWKPKTYFTFLFRTRHQSQKFILQKRQTQKLEGEQTKWKHNFQNF